ANIQLTAPDVDLIVTGVTPTPSTLIEGTSLNLTYTVLNQGSATASSVSADTFYLSDDDILDNSDVSIGFNSVFGQPALAGHTTYTATASLTIPSTTTGSKRLLIVADRFGTFDTVGNQGETNETNNVLSIPVTVSAPDLKVV